MQPRRPSPEKNWLDLEKIQQHFGNIRAKIAKFWKKQQNIQQFLTNILRLESGAKECIV